MKIKYIVTVPKSEDATEANLISETLKSVTTIIGSSRDEVSVVRYELNKEEEEINKEVNKTADAFTHVVIINAGSTLKDHFRKTVEEYVGSDKETIYLPIVELYTEEAGEYSFRAFLNSSLWKPYLTDEVGKLDLKLSKRGIDLIQYGAIIPLDILKKYSFKEDIKYYSYFEFFNRVLSNEVKVKSIPRTLLLCKKDYELKNVSKDEKLEEFKKTQEVFLTTVVNP